MDDIGGDFGGIDWTRQALMQQLAAQRSRLANPPLALNGAAIGAPVVPGQFPGLIDNSSAAPSPGPMGAFPPMGVGQGAAQGLNAPAGLLGTLRGILGRTAPELTSTGGPAAAGSVPPGMAPGSSTLGSRFLDAMRMGAAPGILPPQALQQPNSQLDAMGGASPQTANVPSDSQVLPAARRVSGALPPIPKQPLPHMKDWEMAGALPQLMPQAAPQVQQPMAGQGIPEASAAARLQQAQQAQGGNPLDRYMQMVMGLQRQRMLMAMAGGLLGAPSLGAGLGRAFTNAAETVGGAGGQSDILTRIAGAQAAYEQGKNVPGWNEKDRQALAQQALFGGEKALEAIRNPSFHKLTRGDGKEIDAYRTPSGRELDATYNISGWAARMGFKKPNGDLTYDPRQAESRPLKDGRVGYMMSDGVPRDITLDSPDE